MPLLLAAAAAAMGVAMGGADSAARAEAKVRDSVIGGGAYPHTY